MAAYLEAEVSCDGAAESEDASAEAQDDEEDGNFEGVPLGEPSDAAEWGQLAQAQLESARLLRLGVEDLLPSKSSRHGASATSLASVTSSAFRSTGGGSSGGLSQAEKSQLRRQRIRDAEALARALLGRIEQLGHAVTQLNVSMALVHRGIGELEEPTSVAEQRIALRAARPAGERTEDYLSAALCSEKRLLQETRERLTICLRDLGSLLDAIEKVKAQLIADLQGERQALRVERTGNLIDGFHSDGGTLARTLRAKEGALNEGTAPSFASGARGHVRRLGGEIRASIEEAKGLEKVAARMTSESCAASTSARSAVQEAGAATLACLRRRLAETREIRRQLEKELADGKLAAVELEQVLRARLRELMDPLPTPQPFAARDASKLKSEDAYVVLEGATAIEVAIPGALERARMIAGDHTNLLGLRQAELQLRVTVDGVAQALAAVIGALSRAGSRVTDVVRQLRAIEPRLVQQKEALDGELSSVSASRGRVAEDVAAQRSLAADRLERLKAVQPGLQEDLDRKSAAFRIDQQCEKVRPVKRQPDPAEEVVDLSSPRKLLYYEAPPPKGFVPALSFEVADQLRTRVKAAAYTGHAGRELDVIFRRFDRDGSGALEENEVRRALRGALRIAPSVVPDVQISSLCRALDTDRSGAVSIAELIDFLGADAEVSKRTGKSRHGSILQQVDQAATPPSRADAPRPPRPYRPPLEPGVLEAIRARLKAATYCGHLGRELAEVFGRYDVDHSGVLEDSEVRTALRRSLRISPAAVSDAQIASLCAYLDTDGSGTVAIGELEAFIGAEPGVSKRTGRKFRASAAAAEADDISPQSGCGCASESDGGTTPAPSSPPAPAVPAAPRPLTSQPQSARAPKTGGRTPRGAQRLRPLTAAAEVTAPSVPVR